MVHNSKLLYQPGFGTRITPSAEGIARGDHYVKMQGNEVFKVAVRYMAEVAKIALEANGMSAGDVNMFIPHQANIRILDATAKRIGLTDEQVYINVDVSVTPRRQRSPLPSTRSIVPAASRPATFCCWMPSVAVLPGLRH